MAFDWSDPTTWGTVISGLGLLNSATGSQSAPAAPDYTAAANATAANDLAAQRAATQANRVNTYTPYGSLTYTQDPTNPDKWSSTTTLSPEQQALLDQQNQTKGYLGQAATGMAQNIGSKLGGAMPDAYDPTKATNQATDEIMSRVNPMLDRQQNQLETQLTNQGLQRGTEAWNNAETDFGKQRNDAYTQASLQGINLGQGQQAQTYNQSMTNRNQPLNELNSLMSGTQLQNPTFNTAPAQQGTKGADALGATNASYNASVQNTNTANANNYNTSAGLFGLGTSLLNYKA